jgi:hypothetical protein
MFIIIMLSLISPIQPSGLDAYLWKNRIVIQFTKCITASQEDLWVTQVEEINERDIVVVLISLEKEEIRILNDSDKLLKGDFLRYQLMGMLISELNLEQEQKIFLIGKDGGLKWEGSVHSDLQIIFDKIDTMPMRRSEIKREQ